MGDNSGFCAIYPNYRLFFYFKFNNRDAAVTAGAYDLLFCSVIYSLYSEGDIRIYFLKTLLK